jgi:DNA repair protein RecO
MFEIKYLYMLGIAPNFKRCVVCNKTDSLRFSIKSGGYCCSEHYPENEKTYSENSILTLSKLYYHDMNQPLDITIDQATGIEIRNLLDEYYLYHLSFQSKSRKVLSGLLGY